MHNHDLAHVSGHFTGCAQGHACWCESRRYEYVLCISGAILALEVFGWWLSNSLALLGDAGHVLTDTIALSVALVVSVIVRTKTHARTRTIRLMGFALQLTLLATVAGWLLMEALDRIAEPPQVLSTPLLIAAGLGAAGNIWQVYILEGGFKNITAYAAQTHLFADCATSIGVILGGTLMSLTGWYRVDPIISLLIVCFIVYQICLLLTIGTAHDAHDDHGN